MLTSRAIGSLLALMTLTVVAGVGPQLRADEETTAFADGEIIVRFRPNIVSFPSSGTRAAIEQVEIADPELESLFDQWEVSEFVTVCHEWRFVSEDPDPRDIQGNPLVEPLIDFKDVYRIQCELSGQEIIDACDLLAGMRGQVEYAEPNYLGWLTTSCAGDTAAVGDSLFHQQDSFEMVGQWCYHNPGIYNQTGGGSTVVAVEDVDINLPEAWSIFAAADQKVAVIDGGCDTNHVELQRKIDADLSKCFSGGSCAIDIGHVGGLIHGTVSAGLIAARADSGSCMSDSTCPGVAGVLGHHSAKDSLLVILAIDWGSPGAAQQSQVADAVSYATTCEIPIAMINFEFGSSPTSLRNALRNANVAGVHVLVSGGNGGKKYPQAYSRLATAVACVSIEGDSIPEFSSGPWIDVTAPSSPTDQSHKTGPWSTSFNAMGSVYAQGSATSAAVPQIAGASALVLSYEDTATNEDIEQLLARRARDLGPAGRDNSFGHGLVRLDSTLCWLRDAQLTHGSAEGWDDSTSVYRLQDFRNLSFDSATSEEWQSYYTNVYRLTKWVTFSGNGPLSETGVWCRGRQCSGWSDTDELDVSESLRWAGVVGGTVTAYGCSLETFFYEVFDDTLGLNGWFPFKPFGVTPTTVDWRFTYMNQPDPRIAFSPSIIESHPDSGSPFEAVSTTGRRSVISVTRPVTLSVEIFDVLGRRIRRWQMPRSTAAEVIVEWDGTTASGSTAASGVYFLVVRDEQGEQLSTRMLSLGEGQP